MNDLKRDMMRIQELIGNAFRQTGSLVALTDGGQMNPNKLQKTLEQTMEQFEAATLELRKLCERYAPGSGGLCEKADSAIHGCNGQRGGLWLWLAPYHDQYAAAPLPVSKPKLAQRYHSAAAGQL